MRGSAGGPFKRSAFGRGALVGPVRQGAGKSVWSYRGQGNGVYCIDGS